MSLDITIREANINDTQNLINLKLNYLKDSKTIPLNLDEYPNDYDNEYHLIETLNEQGNSILLVAELDGKLVGNLDIFGNQRQRLFHTGNLGLGIHIDYQNKGIGSQLMAAALEWAQANNFLKIITLDVYATNDPAIHMYKKLGFEESGRIKNFFYQDNTYIDKISMVKHI